MNNRISIVRVVFGVIFGMAMVFLILCLLDVPGMLQCEH
jgi:hypothetical protein